MPRSSTSWRTSSRPSPKSAGDQGVHSAFASELRSVRDVSSTPEMVPRIRVGCPRSYDELISFYASFPEKCWTLSPKKRIDVATIDDRQTATNRQTDDRSRCPGRVSCASRGGCNLRLPGRSQHADAPGAHPLRATRSGRSSPRHEQGGIFAAEGYARTTGQAGRLSWRPAALGARTS